MTACCDNVATSSTRQHSIMWYARQKSSGVRIKVRVRYGGRYPGGGQKSRIRAGPM